MQCTFLNIHDCDLCTVTDYFIAPLGSYSGDPSRCSDDSTHLSAVCCSCLFFTCNGCLERGELSNWVFHSMLQATTDTICLSNDDNNSGRIPPRSVQTMETALTEDYIPNTSTSTP